MKKYPESKTFGRGGVCLELQRGQVIKRNKEKNG